MKNKSRIQRQDFVIFIMNAVIVVLCILLFFAVIFMTKELKYAFSSYYSVDNMVYAVEYGQYEQLVERYHTNTEEGTKVNKEQKEYFGVAQYFEAAYMYKTFEVVGDSWRAAREKAKMEQAYEEMGSWNIVKKDIHEKLGLE